MPKRKGSGGIWVQLRPLNWLSSEALPPGPTDPAASSPAQLQVQPGLVSNAPTSGLFSVIMSPALPGCSLSAHCPALGPVVSPHACPNTGWALLVISPLFLYLFFPAFCPSL